MSRIWLGLLALFMLASCGEPVPRDGQARIMAMGDSLLAWHSGSGRSVSHALEQQLDTVVVDRSVVGAQYLYALPISGSLGLRIEHQYAPGSWDWVILNGGGNDLWLGCGCSKCKARLDRLVSADGTSGEIPKLVARIRAGGAKVAYVGYLRTPGVRSPVEHCTSYGAALEGRIARMAARDGGVRFLSNADLVPNGDRSFHDVDRIHPSPKGSAAIAARLAAVIGNSH